MFTRDLRLADESAIAFEPTPIQVEATFDDLSDLHSSFRLSEQDPPCSHSS